MVLLPLLLFLVVLFKSVGKESALITPISTSTRLAQLLLDFFVVTVIADLLLSVVSTSESSLLLANTVGCVLNLVVAVLLILNGKLEFNFVVAVVLIPGVVDVAVAIAIAVLFVLFCSGLCICVGYETLDEEKINNKF